MLVCGLDLAKAGDYSAAVLLDTTRGEIVAALRLPHGPYRDQLESIRPALEKAGAVAFDRTGVGMAVEELLPAGVRAVPVTITSGANVTVRRGGVSAGKVALIRLLLSCGVKVAESAPGRDALKAEMGAFVVRPGQGGRLKLEARAGSHDDMVLAAALAVLAASIGGGGSRFVQEFD